jgi:hypothetical protein
MHERDATRVWHQLFRGRTITAQTLKEAELVVEELHPESPLRLRLSTELEEIRCIHQGQLPKKRR